MVTVNMVNNLSVYILLFFVSFIILLIENNCQTKKSCKRDEFNCDIGDDNCIPITAICDGKADCLNNKDETFNLCESKLCNSTEYHCAYGGCIPLSLNCNTERDCVDGSDEADCDVKTKIKCSKDWMVSCLSGECIRQDQVCDGIKDCADNSDETTPTCSNFRCPAGTFTCSYGACVDSDSKCNGIPDCVDYSDELLPECKTKFNVTTELICGKNTFKCSSGLCIKEDKLCDGIRDCDDGSDETNRQCKNEKCESGYYRCAYGACTPTMRCVDKQGTSSSAFSSQGAHGSPSGGSYAPNDAYTPPSFINGGPGEGTGQSGSFEEKCIFPLPPENGIVTTNTGMSPNPFEIAPEWTILIYKCNKGFSLGTQPSVIVCMNNKWTNLFPVCLRTCLPLISNNHEIECLHDGKKIPCEQACEGTVANIKCKEAFEIKNFVYQPYNGIQCNQDGNWTNNLFECNPECGTLIPKAQALVIKGYTAAKGEFPWHAGIYRKETSNHDYFEQICGGTLISDKVIISAAHCFWDWNQNQPIIELDKYAVAVGKFYRTWNATRDKHAQYSELQRIILPSRFRAEESSFANDIAILILNNTIKFTSRVRPVCVDWSNELYKSLLKPGALGTVAGWGLTEEFGDTSEELQAVQMPFIEYDTCISDLPEAFRSFITHDKICAGYNNGTSICTGDSGGGIAFKKSNRFFIQGVVSVAPAKGTTCDSYQYVAFTSVPEHLNFIREVERETH